MEDMGSDYLILYYILPLSVLLILILLIARGRKEVIYYLNEIGAERLRTYTYPCIKAELHYGNTKAKLWTSGLRGNFKLNIGVPLKFSGFLVLRKSDFFDKLFFQKTIDELAVIYEDPKWASKILYLKDFRIAINELFNKTNIYSLAIKDKELIISWKSVRWSNIFIEREIINDALQVVIKIINSLTGIPSTIVKEPIRKWLIYKIPLILSGVLVITGILGKFYYYNPVCQSELIIKGYKLVFPLVLGYITFVILLTARNRTLLPGTLGSTLLMWVICSLFINLFFISYINGRFDTSTPTLKRDYIKRKYIGYTKWSSGPRIVLSEFSREKPWWCDKSFRVSKEFYEKAKSGDRVEYATGKGFLGIEWFYSGFRIVE